MPSRNESLIWHEDVYDITDARRWLRAFNRSRGNREIATFFHMFLWACAKALHERPGLNRFVSGGQIYQRDRVFISFAAKREMRDEAPLVTVKVEFFKDEPFADSVDRVVGAIRHGRGNYSKRGIDREMNIIAALPSFVQSAVMRAGRELDRMNLLPAAMIDSDPMFTSLFVANLGSVGLDNTFHHLYEYGTASIFGVLGAPGKRPFIGRDGQAIIRDGVQARWTFDERINDGMYCAASLKLAQQYIESPYEYFGPVAERARESATSPK